jgi:flagellar assembly protein FliH
MQMDENIFSIKSPDSANASKFMFDLSFDEEEYETSQVETESVETPHSNIERMEEIRHEGHAIASGVDVAMQEEEIEVIDPMLEEPAPSHENMFTQEELDEAAKTAHAIGHAAGHEKAMASVENKLAASLDIIVPQIAGMIEIHEKQYKNMLQEAVKIALTAAKKAIPAISAKHGTEEIETIVKECMSYISTEPKVMVKTAPDSVETLKASIEKMVELNAFEGKVAIISDENMAVGDCSIEWSNGGLEKNFEKLWENIEEIIAKNV